MRYQLEQGCNGTRAGSAEARFAKEARWRSSDDAWKWNATPVEPVEACVHSIIKRIVRSQPSAPAVCSWDGDLTYKQLDRLSSRLATHLVDRGVRPGVVVLLFLGKSLLWPVTVLAVMKAGGASLALDRSQPLDQLRSIVSRTASSFLLAAPEDHLALQLNATHLIAISREMIDGFSAPSAIQPQLPEVRPSDMLFVVMTSSNTAPSKAAVITHRNASSAIVYQSNALGFTNQSRVLDHTSHTWHVSWLTLLHTLANGGCLCIPTQRDWNEDIVASTVALHANLIQILPSWVPFLDLANLTDDVRINLVGEQVAPSEMTELGERATVRKFYGLAETTALISLDYVVDLKNPDTFDDLWGGVCCWVVDVDQPDSLAALGAVGELVLEGPLVGSGYFNDKARTATTFDDDPPWLLRGSLEQPGRHGSLLRTGDLVRCDKDGSLSIIGRQEDVKIKDRRIDLSEIAYQVRCVAKRVPHRSSYERLQLVADFVTPQDSQESILIIFIAFDAFEGMRGLPDEEYGAAARRLTRELTEQLSQELSPQMMPTAYIPIREIPLTASGKIDRGCLRSIASLITPKELARLRGLSDSVPQSETERLMQRLWAQVLRCTPQTISLEADFFSTGGDATAALRLCRFGRDLELFFDVGDVFRNPCLRDLAAWIDSTDSSARARIPPFSLLGSVNEEEVRSSAAQLCQVQANEILDAYPCTALQEGLMALTAKNPGDYVSRNVYEIGSQISIAKFRQAWDQVVARNPIMRTRIVSLPQHGIMQVVLETGTSWTTSTDVDAYEKESKHQVLGLGTPLTRFAILKGGDRRFFLWEIHHALYDGWSLPLLLKEAEAAYFDEISEPLGSMNGFIQYISGRDPLATRQFWLDQFEGTKGSHFPPTRTDSSPPKPDCQLALEVQDLGWAGADVTPATFIRAAWAIVMAQSARSNEALFGVTVTGRQAPVADIENMAAPTIATVPIRVTLDWQNTVRHLLGTIQQQAVDMIPYEQTGLQRVRRISEAAALACDFQSLLVVQPAEEEDSDSSTSHFLNEPSEDHLASQWQAFSTYAIVVVCLLEQKGTRLRFEFDSHVISKQRMERIVRGFKLTLKHLAEAAYNTATLKDAAVSSDSLHGIDKIWKWNATVPETIKECIHDMILSRALERPFAPAICAWDGDLTYMQLESLSIRVAKQILGEGVVGTTVPLVFEKSLWTPVAVLAVMKAGAASILMDITQPEERLRGIVSQATSPIILSSIKNNVLAQRLGQRKVMTVGHDNLDAKSVEFKAPDISSSSTLYVVFTSGSTGTPKGAIVTHENFRTAIQHQQEPLGYNKHSRVFDFASYAFDAAWWNLLHALTAGGCLCIPSASERENQLVECFDKYKVTTADLTPSVARFLGPQVLSKLSTLIFGGEAVLQSDAHLAGEETKIMNVYGPAECTPTVTFAEVCSTKSINIGRGAGVCTWLVDVDDSTSLAPLGAEGELWVEGPLVGLGYLDAEKTAHAFIRDPAWLTRGTPSQPGRRGRVYRTGDLAKYNEDGTLVFIGRKDTQVKIRGQRIELGEIEHQVRTAFESSVNGGTSSVQVVVEAIRPEGQQSNILISFINLDNAGDMTEELHSQTVRDVSGKMANRLAEILPTFMIPVAYIPIQRIPMTTTGKTDRRKLQAIGASSWLQYRNATSDGSSGAQPSTDTEKVLQEIWMSVLNLSAAETSVEKAFTRLGGDSITAMQIVSQCRLHNLACTASEVIQASTIRRLAVRCRQIVRQGQEMVSLTAEEEDSGAPFELSPIQQWFFEAFPDGLNHWNQSYMLELRETVAAPVLEKALRALVERHAMLRARFHKDSQTGTWTQSVADNCEQIFPFVEHNVSQWDDLVDISEWRQEHLDIREGPLFACDMFTLPGGRQILVLSAHHLIIDLVSWRIIWADLEDHIRHGELRSEKTVSFQTWCRRQAKASRNASPLTVLPFSIPPADLDFWGVSPSENTVGNCAFHTQTFDRDLSLLLLRECNDSLRTEPIDLLMGAMVHSFCQVFPERDAPTIWIEGHGREQSNELPLDASGTVGWFTTIHPLPITVKSNSSLREAVRLAKDTRRKVPNKGQPFFACKYYSASGRDAFRGHDIVEFNLNFTGRYQQLERDEGLFGSVEQPDDSDRNITEVPEATRRRVLIDVNADVEDGELAVSFTYAGGMRHQERLRQWMEKSFAQAVTDIAGELQNASLSLTLSDLPSLNLSYRGLDVLLKEQLPSMAIEPSAVADIIPCSPLQEGILLSSLRGAASYATYSIWRCVRSDGLSISPSRLEEAWRKVVSRHSILSTTFASHPDGHGFIQIVLPGAPVRISHVPNGADGPVAALSRLEKPEFADNEPEHAFSICVSEAGDVACRFDASHKLIDGASISVLVQDIISVYDGLTLQSTPAFGDLISYIETSSKAQRLASWIALLTGVQPCLFPRLMASAPQDQQEEHHTISMAPRNASDLLEFCKKMNITRSVFLQVAWALVLSQFTGQKEACFGYLASGRDAPVDGVENMVGPLANMLISRVDLRASARQVLESTSAKSIEHLANQHVSLAEIQHDLGLSGRQMFNTSLSVQQGAQFQPANSSMSFEECTVDDPHEVGVTVYMFDGSRIADTEQFDVGLNAGIEGEKMTILVEYREPYVNRQTAQKVASMLDDVFDFLLAIDDDAENSDEVSSQEDWIHVETSEENGSGTTESLYDGFFRRVVGANVASTHAFWSEQFADTHGSHFPPRRAAATTSHQLDKELSLEIEGLSKLADGFAFSTLAKAAWSAITARYSGVDESIFGSQVLDRVSQSTIPVRISLDWEGSVNQLLREVETQAERMYPFRRTGLHRIRQISEEAALACDFQTLLTVRGASHELRTGDYTPQKDVGQEEQQNSQCALKVDLLFEKNSAHLGMAFDGKVIEEQAAWRLAYQFEHVLRQLADKRNGERRLRDVAGISARDLTNIWDWNKCVPKATESCVHDLLARQAIEHPSAAAIDAWDGNLTYEQLDKLSSSISAVLIRKGIGKGTMVPLFFEKSMWMPVAALAVMKTGAACVMVDVMQPIERLRTIATQVKTSKAQLILSSASSEALAQQAGASEVLIIGQDQLTSRDEKACSPLPEVSPSDLLYVVFTSGSTGNPKGVMITHRNFSSAIMTQRESMGFTNGARVLDFASYAFDVAWSNMLNTLTTGCCLCIPSAAERENDLGGCLMKYRVSYAEFTPSVARSIEPKAALSALTTLILGGEAALPNDATLAADGVRLMNTYGPSECTPTSTILPPQLRAESMASIGYGVGLCTWIVDAKDAGKLVPIGAVGELCLEGPLVGSGYLDDPVKTAGVFLDDPVWLTSGAKGSMNGRRGRVYCTGDLVQYDNKGMLLYIGRKDTQVKIRGQRVELGEIEHHVSHALDATNAQVMAEMVQPQGVASKTLAAFILLEGAENLPAEEREQAVRRATARTTERLAQTVPVFMIPSVYIALHKVPRTAAAKIDRKALRAMGAKLTGTDLAALSRTSRGGGEGRAPKSEAERRMQALWAEVLKTEAESIGAEDNFFRIGGDSIGAMRLVGVARREGVAVTVRDVFQHPVLWELAGLGAS